MGKRFFLAVRREFLGVFYFLGNLRFEVVKNELFIVRFREKLGIEISITELLVFIFIRVLGFV